MNCVTIPGIDKNVLTDMQRDNGILHGGVSVSLHDRFIHSYTSNDASLDCSHSNRFILVKIL